MNQICYTLIVAEACVQAFGTLKDGVRPGSRESGNRYGFCALSDPQ